MQWICPECMIIFEVFEPPQEGLLCRNCRLERIKVEIISCLPKHERKLIGPELELKDVWLIPDKETKPHG